MPWDHIVTSFVGFCSLHLLKRHLLSSVSPHLVLIKLSSVPMILTLSNSMVENLDYFLPLFQIYFELLLEFSFIFSIFDYNFFFVTLVSPCCHFFIVSLFFVSDLFFDYCCVLYFLTIGDFAASSWRELLPSDCFLGFDWTFLQLMSSPIVPHLPLCFIRVSHVGIE